MLKGAKDGTQNFWPVDNTAIGMGIGVSLAGVCDIQQVQL